MRERETYVLMDTPVHPRPPVDGRVLGIGHIGGCVETPRGALLRADLPAGTEETPDGLGSTRIARIMLLYFFLSEPDQKKNTRRFKE